MAGGHQRHAIGDRLALDHVHLRPGRRPALVGEAAVLADHARAFELVASADARRAAVEPRAVADARRRTSRRSSDCRSTPANARSPSTMPMLIVHCGDFADQARRCRRSDRA